MSNEQEVTIKGQFRFVADECGVEFVTKSAVKDYDLDAFVTYKVLRFGRPIATVSPELADAAFKWLSDAHPEVSRLLDQLHKAQK